MANYSPDISIRVAVIEENAVEREYLLALVSAPPASPSRPPTAASPRPAGDREGPAGPGHCRSPGPRTIRTVTLAEAIAHRPAAHRSPGPFGRERPRAGLPGPGSRRLRLVAKTCTADQIRARHPRAPRRRGGVVQPRRPAKSSSTSTPEAARWIASATASARFSDLLGRGIQAIDIAARLGLSPSTVRTHVRNLLQKLKATSRTEAVAKYLNPVS